jgi:hypothetical protein
MLSLPKGSVTKVSPWERHWDDRSAETLVYYPRAH